MRITPENIIRLKPGEIFVYGSNLAGIPGKGAALFAAKVCGATYGRCHGLDNQCYGIPTKDERIKVLPLKQIQRYINNFITDAQSMPEITFLVTAIGTGLAGYKPEDIAPMFIDAYDLQNVHLPQEFWDVLNNMIK